ncbi:sodium- and chloride-dependent taurine transporter-like [Strongylocentrotus purpuratus]|uniref:Transporter n=1 Tax=Strongylocentrotus purpuratus TaxID=7668 RepID=A0A7M7HMQ1_STRPU|nr:sodium- and chloride-dependent taurine transporter-like [Strongylocentrotus purpuratus]
MVDKERWSWRFDFLATNVGFVACFDNLWRFPFLCYVHGGVVFLVPYFLCSLFLATPLLFLEMALGQYTSSGPIRAWKICPIFQGIGVATTVVAWWRNIYYNVILAWTLYYLYSSCIGGELPWARCNNEWNTASCLNYGNEWVCVNGTYIPIDKWNAPPEESPAPSWSSWNEAVPLDDSDQCGNYPLTTNPAQEFWRIKVLGQTGTGGRGIVGHLALTLFLAWTLVYFGLRKGVKWSGKVAYFTVPFIHLVFAVLMIRGITLPGAYDGLIFYLKPIPSRLNAQAWIAAGTEVFYSFSIGLGAFTALGSFNKFHYNFYRDSIIAAYLNVWTSIYSGIIVFTFLGVEAYSEGISPGVIIADGSGSGRFFKVFPRSFAALPVPRVWSIFFFLAVLTIGLNSQLVMVKAFITSVLDLFPTWLRIGYYKEVFVLGVCFLNFLIGLSMVTQDGEYVLWLFDAYGSGIFPLIWICFFESIAIGWVYGVRKFSFNIAEMLRWQQIQWYIICWIATVPVIALFVWISNIVSWSTLSLFSNPLGICMALSSMVCIPAGMVYAVFYQLIKGDGPTFTRLERVIQPAIVPVLDEVHPDCFEML